MEQSQVQVDSQERVRLAMAELFNSLNAMGGTKAQKAAVKDAFVREHRTLQQNFVKVVVLGVLEQLDEAHTSGRFDLRNQDSVEMAHKMLERVPEEERYLSFV